MLNAYPIAKLAIKTKKKTADECYEMINTYFAYKAVTSEQYAELCNLIFELYGE